MLTGVFTALVTPFKDGAVDEPAFRDLIEWQIGEGVDGLVPCGTTGEAVTLSDEEYVRVIRLAVATARKRVPVVAGAGSNSTAKAMALTALAEGAGVDGLLHVTPYYNKPTQEGLYQHYAAVAKAATRPILLYNVPGRTGVNLLPETVARLAKLPNIVGVKDASGSLPQATETLRSVPDAFLCLSGEDSLNYPLYSIGYRGTISVVSNLLPKWVSQQWDAVASGDHATAARLHRDLAPIAHVLFLESNPIPVKTALAMKGKCREEFRLPLTPMSEANKAQLRATMDQLPS